MAENTLFRRTRVSVPSRAVAAFKRRKDAVAGSQEVTTTWADPDYYSDESGAGTTIERLQRRFSSGKRHRIKPTTPGAVFLLLCLTIGSAAYNTANNILFLTLSLFFSSLLLNGVLSWLNFRKLGWALELPRQLRVGESAPVRLVIENRKRVTPTYSIWFHLQTLLTPQQKRLPLAHRLDPGARATIEWKFTPTRRGTEVFRLSGMESSYPFGLLNKTIGRADQREGLVWPARVPYTFAPPAGGRSRDQGRVKLTIGSGTDLHNIRPYRHGDPVRFVHWKQSARSGQLMTREMSDDNQDSYNLIINSSKAVWQTVENLDKLCAFAGSLAEDLFKERRLNAVLLNEQYITIRRLSDLHFVFDQLAMLELLPDPPLNPMETQLLSIRFKPATDNTIHAFIAGHKAGAA